jgi:hypothetical protein
MPLTTTANDERSRNLFFLQNPMIWPQWPYLPLVRRKPECEEEYGVLYDAYHKSGLTGYGATVFLSNLFLLPETEAEILALFREVYDNAEEIYAAGWRID